MPEARLPFGKQISPNQIDLRQALRLVRDIPGDKDALYQALGEAFWPTRPEKDRKTSGMNTFLAGRHYGLITPGDDYALTELGKKLLATETDQEFNDLFAQHILLHLNGLQMLEVVDSLQARGESVNASKVVEGLSALGIDPGGDSGENINPMRLWLEKAGVLTRWTINPAAVKRLTGASTAEISEIVDLDERQQAFLRALATITDEESPVASKVRALAELQAPDVIFDTKTFAAAILEPLRAAGWIDVERATSGRGAKSPRITPTRRFNEVISEPLMTAVLEQTHLQDPVALRRPLTDLLDVVADLTNTSHARGMALEGVCIQLVRMLGGKFVGWRVRGDITSGAEVDVVAESVNPPYQLIQLQSKASAILGREIVDREVGIAQTLKSNVILFVSAQKIGDAARHAAAAYMQETNLALLFLDGADVRGGAATIAAAMEREWSRVRSIKSKRGQERTRSVTS